MRGQSSQMAFGTALLQALHVLDPDWPVLIAAESARIGAPNLPPALWEAMKTALWITVSAPLEARALYLSRTDANMLAHTEAMMQKRPALRDPLATHSPPGGGPWRGPGSA